MKLQLKKILVPLDFSETGRLAMEHAAELAKRTKAELTIVHVMPLTPYYFEIPEPIFLIGEQEEMRRTLNEKLKDTAHELTEKHKLVPKTILLEGRVANNIIQAARDEKSDLVIMGTHGAKGFEELFIGSNAQKVVNLAPCPVITIQSHAKKTGFRNIVLPIDRSAHSREKVTIAAELASVYDAKIHLLGLLEDTDEDHEYAKLQLVLDQVQAVIEKHELSFTRHTRKGSNLAETALRFGEGVKADLIIIMTDHESSLTGIFLGALAGQIVNHSRIPVMSIKPNYGHFESINLSGAYKMY